MLRIVALLLGLGSVATPVQAERVRVASYNVRNYLVTDRQVDGEWRFAYPKPAVEVAALQRVILEVRPDVLALQEIGPAYLRELQRDLAAQGLDYPYTFQLVADDEDRCLAVLARVPVVEARLHRDLRFRYFEGEIPVKRGLLEVEFLVRGVSWHLFTFHLKSRLTEDARDPDSVLRRGGEAEAVATLLRERWPEGQGRFILLGDANDDYRSPALEHLRGPALAPLAQPIPARDSRGEVWTYFSNWADRYERIDYALLSARLQPHLVTPDARLFDGPDSMLASDHRLLFLDLQFPEPSVALEKETILTDQ
ncbi:MAG: endonuclease/exonuclease/phosphatase family protein [Verrucomicrobiota bacterium JB022]|nr:endonuclease/exonuclease/phosphatase family protein [Verrucomicrobiota bacterium JB022]